jgi:hypothetical protein
LAFIPVLGEFNGAVVPAGKHLPDIHGVWVAEMVV